MEIYIGHLLWLKSDVLNHEQGNPDCVLILWCDAIQRSTLNFKVLVRELQFTTFTFNFITMFIGQETVFDHFHGCLTCPHASL